MFDLLIMLLIVPLNMYDDPSCVRNEYGEGMYDYRDNYKTLFQIMENQSKKHPTTLYFLSKFPTATYDNGGVDESGPPWLHSRYQYDTAENSAELKFLYKPCRFGSIVEWFEYKDHVTGMTIRSDDGFRDLFEEKQNTSILEAIHDVSLYKTHEKWINHNEKTVYVLYGSSEELVKRGYITKQLEFFRFGNDLS